MRNKIARDEYTNKGIRKHLRIPLFNLYSLTTF